jgi:hypothetical protein
MRSIASAVIFALLIPLAAPSFSAEQKPDFRQVTWGMTKDEVKKNEKAEKVKETDSILVYLIKGGPKHEIIHTHPDLDGKSMELSIDIDVPDYNLVYLFPDGKLGMAIMHMDKPGAKPWEYKEEFERQTDMIDEETGKEPYGQAKYGENESEDTVFEHPEGICTGRYGIRYLWPAINDRTNIMIELDDRKSAEDKSECTLAIFYESVKFPVEPADSAKMHEAL